MYIVPHVIVGDVATVAAPCTDLNFLCYNSFTGQGQLLWVRVACSTVFGQRFSLVSMVSINLGIRFDGVETGDAGESIEPEESH